MPNGDDENNNSQNVDEETAENGQGNNDNNSSANDGDGQNSDEGHDSSITDDELDAITDPDELRKMLKTTKGQNSKLFARIQDSKGLKLDKKTGKWVPKNKPQQNNNQNNNNSNGGQQSNKNDLTQDEMFLIIEAKVPREDISLVRDYARMNKVSIEDALKAPLVTGMLSERAEERTTADATNTGPSRGGQRKPNAVELLKNAESKGEIPEDDAAVGDLVEARLQKRIGNK